MEKQKTIIDTNKKQKKIGIVNICIITLLILVVCIYIFNVTVPTQKKYVIFKKIGIITKSQEEELIREKLKQYISTYIQKREENLHKLKGTELLKATQSTNNVHAELKTKELVLNINKELKKIDELKNEKVEIDNTFAPFIYMIKYNGGSERIYEYTLSNGDLKRKDIEEEKLGNAPVIWLKEDIFLTAKGEIIPKISSEGKIVLEPLKLVEAYDREDKKISSKIEYTLDVPIDKWKKGKTYTITYTVTNSKKIQSTKQMKVIYLDYKGVGR